MSGCEIMNIKKLTWVLRACFYGLITKVGLPSYIGSPIFVSRISGIRMGKRVRIYPGMRAEIETKESSITIGNDVSIGQGFHVVSYNDDLRIGSHVTISARVMITNCDHSYEELEKHILRQPLISKPTRIGDYCFIGYGAVIQAGTNLGKQCIVGANSVVRGDFPDYCVIAGVPAKVIKKYNQLSRQWEKVGIDE